MPNHFHIMPVDRTTINTRLLIHPALLDDPNVYIRNHGLHIRTSQPSRGRCERGPTRNLTLDVLTYKGIKVKLRNVTDDPLTDVTIDFNPGVCLYGHNGSALTLAEFLDALGLLVTHLRPLLKDPEDWVDLIPGLRSGGVAYWYYLEIFLQCADYNGSVLAGFRNAQRGNGNTPIRHWPESMVIGGKRSKLQFGIYRKAVEMVAKGKLPSELLPDYRHILRLEVRLKGDKLVHYLGNERNVEEIDGVKRLVRFYPQDHVTGHRTSFSELQGVFCSGEPFSKSTPRDQLTPLGRMLARVALDPRTSLTLPQLLDHIRFYSGASTDTMGKVRKASMAELSRLSAIVKEDLFSDAAYRAGYSICSREQEEKVLHEAGDVLWHGLITAAYCPPSRFFQPITQLPGFDRV